MRLPDLSRTVKAALILPLGMLSAALLLIAAQSLFGHLVETTSFAAFAPAAQEATFVLSFFGLLALVAFAGMLLFGQHLPIGPRPAWHALGGVGLGLLGLSSAVSLSAVSGTTTSGLALDLNILLLLLGLSITLVQTSAEEIFFRGWMQPALQAGWGRWPGLLVTSVAFSGLHFVAGEFDLLSMINLFLGGLFFGLLLDRSGSIMLPIGAHFGWNAAEEFLFGVTPNPGTGSFGAITDWDLVGVALWGGSETGLNASLSATFALVALIAAVASWEGRPSLRLLPARD